MERNERRLQKKKRKKTKANRNGNKEGADNGMEKFKLNILLFKASRYITLWPINTQYYFIVHYFFNTSHKVNSQEMHVAIISIFSS